MASQKKLKAPKLTRENAIAQLIAARLAGESRTEVAFKCPKCGDWWCDVKLRGDQGIGGYWPCGPCHQESETWDRAWV